MNLIEMGMALAERIRTYREMRDRLAKLPDSDAKLQLQAELDEYGDELYQTSQQYAALLEAEDMKGGTIL